MLAARALMGRGGIAASGAGPPSPPAQLGKSEEGLGGIGAAFPPLGPVPSVATFVS